MPSLKAIRKRITSVKSTQKITRAMKMVAGARLVRAQQRIVALRPYAVKTGEVLRSVAGSMAAPQGAGGEGVQVEAPHPLLADRAEKKVLYVVLTSDRGLCGGFNTSITKAAEREWQAKQTAGIEVSFATIGRKGREYLQRRHALVVNDFLHIYEGLDLHKATEIRNWLVPRYLKGEWDAIYLIFNEFKSAISQKLIIDRLLPLTTPDASAAEDAGAATQTAEFLFEPNAKALLERLLPMYLEVTIYRALLESQASEFGARMSAMDSATRNAKEMIARLTLQYNRARQAAITKELMEIIGGAEALKE